MGELPLAGKRIGVLVESQFIPEEIGLYRTRFAELGARVDLMSYLWGAPRQTFLSKVEFREGSASVPETPSTLDVDVDVTKVRLEDYAAVIMAANYTSVRLRYFVTPSGQDVTPGLTRTAPAVEFFARAMQRRNIIKGLLCHGLWILTPVPECLAGRKVICHEVVLADVINTGAVYTPSPDGVVDDEDLVTGRSYKETSRFIDRIARQIRRVDAGELSVGGAPRRPPIVRHAEVPGAPVATGIVMQVFGQGRRMNVLHWNMQDGASVERHAHPHEQFGYCIRGGFRIVIGDETFAIGAGDAYYIPPDAPHSFVAVGATEAIDVFSPVRLSYPGGPEDRSRR